jgi:hypothetical protein
MNNEQRRAGIAAARITNARLAAEATEMLAELDAIENSHALGPTESMTIKQLGISAKAEAIRAQLRGRLAQIEEWDRLLDEADLGHRI